MGNAANFVEKLHHGTGKTTFYFEKWVVDGEKKTRTFRGRTGAKARLKNGADSYVSMNNYREDAKDKSSSNVESVNGFFVDIDICHNEKAFDEKKADFIRTQCMEIVKRKLGERYACYCCSGRGIALFYLYDKPVSTLDERTMKGHKNAYKSVINAFRHTLRFYIEGGDVEVDGTVTDLARVVRIPGTRNNGAGRNAFVVEENWERQYPPEMLWEMFAEYKIEEKYTDSQTRQEPRRARNLAVSGRSRLATRRERMGIFSISGGNDGVIPAVYRNNSLGICEALEYIVANRTMGEGSLRNNMLFIYYNNLKVFYSREPETAVGKVFEMNASFDVPLEESEVKGILYGVDSHVELSGVHGDGFYLFSRERVAEIIQMTEEEEKATGFFRSRDKRMRTAKNKDEKRKDEATIVSLWKEGATWRQIASKTGRSNSLIGRVIEAERKKEREQAKRATKGTSATREQSVCLDPSVFYEKETSCFDLENKQERGSKQSARLERGSTVCLKDTRRDQGSKAFSVRNGEYDPECLFDVSGDTEKVAKKEEFCDGSGVLNFDRAYTYSESNVEKDEELMSVVELLMSGGNAYVSGKGGTGKSLVSKTFVKKSMEAGREVLVVAPSGLAAVSVGGQTVHSAISMEASEVFAESVKPGFKGVKSLRGVDTVLVDECGMLRIDHFAYLVKTIRSAERKYRKRIQLVMVGDFLQIRPVVTKKDREELSDYYGEKYTYQAYEAEDLWRSCLFRYARLEKNRRQVDETFAEFMDKARNGDTSCVPYFRQFEKNGMETIEEGYVHLLAYRRDVNGINAEIIRRHRNDQSFRTFEGSLVRGRFTKDAVAYKRQSFYEGMPVMAVENHRSGLYQNGQMGVVKSVGKASIDIMFQGSSSIVRMRRKVIELSNAHTGECNAVKAFPVLPAYAITIHKCQSQTFEKVVIHASKGGMFEEGQMYVALSRVKSPEGLAICGHIKESDIERPRLQKMRDGETFLRDYEREAILF